MRIWLGLILVDQGIWWAGFIDMKNNQLLEDAMNHASDLSFIIAQLVNNAYHSKDTYAYNVYTDILKMSRAIENALDNKYINSVNSENPAVIARPLKTAKKLKWWAIGLLDENNNLVNRVVTPFRTRTEAKLFARSSLQKYAMGKLINVALVEGPFKTMTEAQSALLELPM